VSTISRPRAAGRRLVGESAQIEHLLAPRVIRGMLAENAPQIGAGASSRWGDHGDHAAPPDHGERLAAMLDGVEQVREPLRRSVALISVMIGLSDSRGPCQLAGAATA
jgi:hypothetical protein